MKSGSRKRTSSLGRFIDRVYHIYFPGDHGYFGTDADHVPIIPGNDFTADDIRENERPLQAPAPGNMDMGQPPAGD
jgi:hypothetical protein